MSQGVVAQDGDMVGIDAPGLGWLDKPGLDAIFEALILSLGRRRVDTGTGGSRSVRQVTGIRVK